MLGIMQSRYILEKWHREVVSRGLFIIVYTDDYNNLTKHGYPFRMDECWLKMLYAWFLAPLSEPYFVDTIPFNKHVFLERNCFHKINQKAIKWYKINTRDRENHQISSADLLKRQLNAIWFVFDAVVRGTASED